MNADKQSTVGPWPAKNGSSAMPDLSDLPYVSVFFAAHRYLAGGGPADSKSYALVMNFIRIVDKAVIDYELAREQMELWATTPNEAFGHLPVAIGHFESCLAAMVRAVKFARKIRQRESSANLVPKGLLVLRDVVFQRINAMRNAVEHLDQDIWGDKLAAGTPICLVVRPKAVEIVGKQISFDELADWIKRLHALANDLAHYRPPQTEKYSPVSESSSNADRGGLTGRDG